jgi:hypothetical protein
MPRKAVDTSSSIAEGLSSDKKEAMTQILDRLENLSDKRYLSQYRIGSGR